MPTLKLVEAAPLYLKRRIERGDALPEVEMLKKEDAGKVKGEVAEDYAEELPTVVKHLRVSLKDDLVVELLGVCVCVCV